MFLRLIFAMGAVSLSCGYAMSDGLVENPAAVKVPNALMTTLEESKQEDCDMSFDRTMAPSGVAVLSNSWGRVIVGVVGATVLSYVPTGGTEVFFRVPGFCSETCAFPHGGMPVAWPWFGRKNGTNVESDLHGFVRRLPWKIVLHTESQVVLELLSGEKTKSYSDSDFRLTSTVTLGKRLCVVLRYANLGGAELSFRTGFHPFFRVFDNSTLVVRGLDGLSEIPIGADAAYRPSSGDIELLDKGLGRKIIIGASGCDLVNVWNDYAQWPKIYERGGGKEFCCIEPMIWVGDSVGKVLKPGEHCELAICIGVTPLNGCR